MLRFALSSLAVAAAIFSSGCEEVAKSAGPPQIHFTEMQKDLGELPVHATHRHLVGFDFTNRGLSPLRITHVKTSCGCAEPAFTKSTLQPGEEAQVTVRLAAQVPERRRALMTVHSNDPINPHVQLHFSWRSFAPIEFKPNHVDFGTLLPGEVAAKELELVRRESPVGLPPCEINRLQSSPARHVRVKWVNEGPLADEVTCENRLRIEVVAGAESQEMNGYVTVHLINGWKPSIGIPVSWKVRDVIEASPSSLLLGTGPPGKNLSGTVVVSANPGERLEVVEAELKGAKNSKATWEQDAQDRVVVRIQADLPDDPGQHRWELKINCEQPVAKILTVPVSTFVLAPVE